MTREADFFHHLFGDCLDDGRFIELRRFHNGERRQEFFPSVEKFLEVTTRWEPKWDYYYGVNPRDTENGTSEAVTHASCIWADVDWKAFEGGREEAIKKIQDFPLGPTVVIESGHGFHVYWLFKEPEELEDEGDFRRIVEGVQKILCSDKVDDLPRILRIPGTLNYKDPSKPILVKINFDDYNRRYSISDFEPFAISPEEDNQFHKVAATVTEHFRDGHRNNALFSIAGTMRRRGLGADEIFAALQATNKKRCKPPLPDSELEELARSAVRYEPENPLPVNALTTDDRAKPNPEIKEWPILATEALYGLAGDYVKAIEPHTEADPVALLLQMLTFLGNVVGRGPHFVAEADRHGMNLFAALVGETSKGRKGASLGHVRKQFRDIDEQWEGNRILSGLSSGEGLIWNVRDPITKLRSIKEKNRITGYEDEITDKGVEDKRLLTIESEFASTLRVMSRDGNTLSARIRDAWDHGSLCSMTKNSPAKAPGALTSIIAHVTRGELIRYLDKTEAGNGFGNRFLWVCVRRSKCLPEGGGISDVDFSRLGDQLSKAVMFAKDVGEIRRDDQSRAIWNEIYPELSEGKPGLLGAMIARAEAQVMRLSCIYALLDHSKVIRKDHLWAALALWEYCEESARYIFGDTLGDPVADDILKTLRSTPEGVTRTELNNIFKRNKTSHEITRGLDVLLEKGLVIPSTKETKGRTAQLWLAKNSTN